MNALLKYTKAKSKDKNLSMAAAFEKVSKEIGIGLSYVRMISYGTRVPSVRVANLIDKKTKGAVPAVELHPDLKRFA